MDKAYIKKLQNSVVDRLLEIKNSDIVEECSISIIDFEAWEWPQGVGLYGLYKQYVDDNNQEGIRWISEWFNRRIKEGLPEKNINTMAPMLTLVYIYERTQNTNYYDLCSAWADWVIEEMPRTKDNGLQHVVTGNENKGQLWDDTLYMTVLFIAKWGKVTGDRKYTNEAVRQFLVHTKYLFDTKTGLWFHGFQFAVENHNFSKALWGRGNCWITAAIPDFIEILGTNDGVAMFLTDTLKMQIDALAKYQDDSGLWHTLIDDPTSYLETSASAGFGYGILKALRMGLIGEEYKEIGIKALHGVLNEIDSSGVVRNVSYGTAVSHSLEDYKKIPICPMAYGQSLTFMLINEALKS